MANSGAKGAGDDKKNKLEWTVFAISLLLIMIIIGYLSYQVYAEKEETPDVIATLKFDPSKNNPYRFLVTVENKGGQTAATVTIAVTMKKGGEELETAELQIPFVPKESVREGWVNFSQNPALADTVEAHVLSFQKP